MVVHAMHDETSNTWLQSMKTADARATGWFYLLDSYGAFIRAILQRRGLTEAACDDVAQNVLATVAMKLAEFERRRTGSFRTWLRRITINCLRDYQKSKQYRTRAEGGTEMHNLALELEDPCGEFTQMWNREHARHVLEELLRAVEPEFTPKSIDIFHRLAVQGEPVDRVAEDTSTSRNACLVARSRVLRRLREVAGEYFGGEELFER